MSDYVNVYLRVRPSIRAQNIENELIDREISTERMVVVDSMPFQFDRIFYQEDSQADVFKHMVIQLLSCYFFISLIFIIKKLIFRWKRKLKKLLMDSIV